MISLITGVGKKGQVGEAVAATLAARGDTVLLVSRNEHDVRERAQTLGAAGKAAYGYGCDLADPAAVDGLVNRVRREHGGRLDCLVNLAGGFALSGAIAQSDPAAFERLVQLNLTTAYLTTRAFFPGLQEARGAIVFFASEVVLEGARTQGTAAYAAGKAAVVALMRSVADEGRPLGVRANAVAPGSVRTATNEALMGSETRYVEREDVAAAVAFLTSTQSRAVTGQVLRLR